MQKELSDLDLFTKFQYGARTTAMSLEEQDPSLAQLMLMIGSNYNYIEGETSINHGCVHVRVGTCRHYLISLAAFAWMAVAEIDGKAWYGRLELCP